MKDRKDKGAASIALMSSQVGQAGVYGFAAYSATKFGLRGLEEALQQEVLAYNIHLSVIPPPPPLLKLRVLNEKGRQCRKSPKS
ncbi:hypothetical protein HRI_002761700 [Hibiscus trionum]|uniref:3-ketodihydrosphingosine reductase n=1 Tax=Hibiscus trionum TaxID=183268 RepID=A0A9W7I7P7_HIBTR|nr:hypothetical protein HRI_002761700 [Hibiscus trionum]